MEERVRYGVGLSYYNGGVYQGTKNVYEMAEVGGVKPGHVSQGKDVIFRGEVLGRNGSAAQQQRGDQKSSHGSSFVWINSPAASSTAS